MRRGQSLVEFAVCLPFLLMLMAAMAEFGLFLHHRETLMGVARAGGLELAAHEGEPDRQAVSRVRRRMLFMGEPVGLELKQIQVGPASEHPGHYEIILRSPHQGLTPFDWLGGPDAEIAVRLVVPVEGS